MTINGGDRKKLVELLSIYSNEEILENIIQIRGGDPTYLSTYKDIEDNVKDINIPISSAVYSLYLHKLKDDLSELESNPESLKLIIESMESFIISLNILTPEDIISQALDICGPYDAEHNFFYPF